MKSVKITDFIQNDYKNYWEHENRMKNAIDPREGLKVVERKILFAAKMMNLQTGTPVLTRKLGSDTGLYHISGEQSVFDTIKGMASTYKRQPETCLLKGIGAFPTSASNTGAAARYTSVVSTPLSRQIFEDIDFTPWIVDDSGVEQVQYISPAFPLALIRGYKGIGVGKACYITERKYDDIYKWSKEIIDIAYPNTCGTGWSKRFYDEISKTGISKVKDIREYKSENLFHDEIQNEKKIQGIKMPSPFNYMGARVEYNDEKHSVMFYPKIDKVIENRKVSYYITALPLESSDRVVVANIRAKLGDKIGDLCFDRSGDGESLKLEIPKKIAEDESLWFGLRMKRGFTESYLIWDEELNTTHCIKYLYPILLSWYKTREEVVTRRLYSKVAKSVEAIRINNLVKKYYDLKESKKIKEKNDVPKFFTEEETNFLINLPEKTYLKDNIDKLDEENKKLEGKIEETKNNIENIKEFIFDEWLRIGEVNRKFIEA